MSEETKKVVKPKVKAKDVYVVKQGDTLSDIAIKHNMPWQTLAVKNQIKAPYRLSVGMELKLG